MKSIKSKKKWVQDYGTAQTLVNDLEVLLEFQEMGEVGEEEVTQKYEAALELIENLEFKNMLSDEGDELTAVLQITEIPDEYRSPGGQ